MTNSVAALIIFSLWLADGRRNTLTLAIFIYFLLVGAIQSIAALSPDAYYIIACAVDLSIIGLIVVLSFKYQNSVLINLAYCAIILFSMSLSGLTLIDQTAKAFDVHLWHKTFNSYVIYADLTFAVLGCRIVQQWIANRFLPFGCGKYYNSRNRHY